MTVRETGLYYLQSRYYNPTWGRFINADGATSTGQGFIGNNMFAYCLNNPVNGCDPCGTCFHRWDFWNDCDKCGGKTIDKKLENLRGTLSNGLTASLSTGIWAFSVQVAKSVDLKGNVEYQLSLSGGISTGTPSFDISAVATVTNAPDAESLEGLGYNIGASGAIGGAIGLDGVIVPDSSGEDTYLGGSVSAGIGAGADVHVIWGKTYSIFGYNVFDVLECLLPGD